MNAAPKSGEHFLSFDGKNAYVNIPSLPCYSVDYTGEFTVAAWIRADIEDFTRTEDGKPYVHWMGKGEGNHIGGTQEWTCRMYSLHTPGVCPARPQRTSFYVFNPQGGYGVGSYVQESVQPGTWRLIVGMADRTRTYLYCNGVPKGCSTYRGPAVEGCQIMQDPKTGQQVVINPLHGPSPLRIGAQEIDESSGRFMGGITKVRIWNRLLTGDEIVSLYTHDIAPRDWLAGEFLLNEGRGTLALDTGYVNHGAIHGASWAIQE